MGQQTSKMAPGTKNHGSGTRTLIYIPIIHTQADMGALSEFVQRLKVEKPGRKGWPRNVNLVNKFWTQIEQAVESLALPYQQVRLYQDGLPVCGRELEIVTEQAKAGSRNHRLLLCLKEKGATIMGTESSGLLLKEYETEEEDSPSAKAESVMGEELRPKALRDSLLEGRDEYIARRINETLRAGEMGLIFLGMPHSLGSWLDKDIRVVYLFTSPQSLERKSNDSRWERGSYRGRE